MKNKKFYVVNVRKEIIEAEKYLNEQGDRSNSNAEFYNFVDYEVNGKVRGGESDYIKKAEKLGFRWESNAKVGFLNYDYKARWMMDQVIDFAKNLVRDLNFPVYEVSGSNLFDVSHPVVSAYANLYGDRLFKVNMGGDDSVMSYDASYPQFNLAASYKMRESNLPFAHFSLSDCYRYEQSGECMMMYRLRRFYMPDLHPYFKNVEEAFNYYAEIERKLLEGVAAAGREYNLMIEVGSLEFWNDYRDQIVAIVENYCKDALIAVHNDNKARYWIVNCDYKIMDKLGHSREICCIQIDVGNAQRLGIKYLNAQGNDDYPVIIHAAVPGGIERYLYMVIDNIENNFPFWLNPCQLRIIPVSEKFISLVSDCLDSLCKRADVKDIFSRVRIEIDDRNESVGKRVLLANQDMVGKSIVVGEKEIASGLEDHILGAVNEFLRENEGSISGQIYEKLPVNRPSWPRLVSKQLAS